VDERIARPTLIGRPSIIAQRIEKFGLRLKEGADYDVVNVEHDSATATSGRPTTA
jgi:malate dehydrogenase (oxaloacetate-decarboxylating)(NADP+)